MDTSFTVADTTFFLRNRTGRRIAPFPPPYLPFVSESPQTAAHSDVQVMYEVTGRLNVDGLQKLYDLSPSFSTFVHPDGRLVLCRRAARTHASTWLAAFPREVTEVDVWIDTETTGVRSDKQTLPCSPLTAGLDQALLMYRMASETGILIHGTGARLAEKGCLFCGRSGQGKSTLARLFQLGRGSKSPSISAFSDERVVVRKSQRSAWQLYGTPWCSSAGIAENRVAALHGMFFLHHGTRNAIGPLTPGDALERLLPVATIAWADPDTLPQLLSTCEQLVAEVPAFDLHFVPVAQTVDFLKRFMADRT